MNTNTPTPKETPEEREKLLSGLRPQKRAMIERILEQHSELTAAEAIEHASAMGGL